MEEQPIIIKRKKKVVGGHHGGSWKVAFADFATAMMAFFSGALAHRHGEPPRTEKGGRRLLQGSCCFTEGGSPNPVDLEGSASVIEESTQDQEASTIQIEDEVVDELADTLEQRRMQELFQELQERIEQNQTLQEFKDQLLIDITDEGLRIQIVDRSGRPMFDSGRAELKYYSQDILFELAKTLGGQSTTSSALQVIPTPRRLVADRVTPTGSCRQIALTQRVERWWLAASGWSRSPGGGIE